MDATPMEIDPILLEGSDERLNMPSMTELEGGNHGIPITEAPVQSLSPALSAPIRHKRRIVQDAASEFSKLSLVELKAHCKSLKLKVSGNKGDLIRRLEKVTPSRKQTTECPIENPDDMLLSQSAQAPKEVNTKEVLQDSAELAAYFESGLNLVENDIVETNLDDTEDDTHTSDEEEDGPGKSNHSNTDNSVAWADKFILETRRKGGRQTEQSVLKLWNAWAAKAISSGLIPDLIIDVKHMIEYLKYAATRQLLTTRGEKKTSSSRLSASSLKKIMTMLGRVRRRQEEDNPTIKVTRPAKSSRLDDFYRAAMVQAQRLRIESEDFDITQGTILDSRLHPEQYNEVTKAIFGMDQITSIIKAHFSWTWQCSTLNRSDELASMLMSCLQPFDLTLADYTNDGGIMSSLSRDEFGVLALFHETKVPQPGVTEPKYNFALPHRNPLRCPVGALAILLHYALDQRQLVSLVPEWEWKRSHTWREFHVLFGKTPEKRFSADSISKMYGVFLKKTTITSKKRAHLIRIAVPKELEDKGVPADQVDTVGHWIGNTRRQVYGSKIPKAASVALAGFRVGESYNVPWAKVKVPDNLQAQIFPFAEEALVNARLSGCQNQGVFNFLELLVKLRPFFWRAIAAISNQFPQSGLVKRLIVLSSQREDTSKFIAEWPALLHNEELIRHQSLIVEQTFNEAPTRQAFSAVSSRLYGLQEFMNTTATDLSVLKRRTEQLSPSKKPQTSLPHGSKAKPLTLTTASPLVCSSCANRDIAMPHHLAHFTTVSEAASTDSQATIQIQTEYIPQPEDIQAGSLQEHQVQPLLAPYRPAPNLLIPYKVTGHILLPLSLPASLEHPHPRTPHDLILPPPSAFQNSMYPRFTTQGCTWQHIFEHITNPMDLWISYAPGTLGDYPNVKSLWQAWDEGTYVANVGRKPALRLIDAQWGSLKNQEMHKGKFPSWRPRNNENVRKIWSKFYFFIQRIDEKMKTGHSADDAIAHFEHLRGAGSLSQLHKSLQTKRKVFNRA